MRKCCTRPTKPVGFEPQKRQKLHKFRRRPQGPAAVVDGGLRDPDLFTILLAGSRRQFPSTVHDVLSRKLCANNIGEFGILQDAQATECGLCDVVDVVADIGLDQSPIVLRAAFDWRAKPTVRDSCSCFLIHDSASFLLLNTLETRARLLSVERIHTCARHDVRPLAVFSSWIAPSESSRSLRDGDFGLHVAGRRSVCSEIHFFGAWCGPRCDVAFGPFRLRAICVGYPSGKLARLSGKVLERPHRTAQRCAHFRKIGVNRREPKEIARTIWLRKPQ